MKSLISMLLAAARATAVTRSNFNVDGRSVINYAPSGASSPALTISMHGNGHSREPQMNAESSRR